MLQYLRWFYIKRQLPSLGFGKARVDQGPMIYVLKCHQIACWLFIGSLKRLYGPLGDFYLQVSVTTSVSLLVASKDFSHASDRKRLLVNCLCHLARNCACTVPELAKTIQVIYFKHFFNFWLWLADCENPKFSISEHQSPFTLAVPKKACKALLKLVALYLCFSSACRALFTPASGRKKG